MKKGFWVLPIALLSFIFLLIGVLIGRSTRGNDIIISHEAGNVDSTEVSAESSDDTNIGKVNINTATADQLMLIPNIGETLAKRIIEYREENGAFYTVNELLFINGISNARLDSIRDYITLGG